MKHADRKAVDTAAVEQTNTTKADIRDDTPVIEVAVKGRDSDRVGTAEMGGDAVDYVSRPLWPSAGKGAARGKAEPMFILHVLLAGAQHPDHAVEAQARTGQAEIAEFLDRIVVQRAKQRGPMRPLGGKRVLVEAPAKRIDDGIGTAKGIELALG